MRNIFHTNSIATKLSILFTIAGALIICTLFFTIEHIEEKELELYQAAEIKNRFELVEYGIHEKKDLKTWQQTKKHLKNITEESQHRIFIRVDSSNQNYRINAPFNIDTTKIDSQGTFDHQIIDNRRFTIYSQAIPANDQRPEVILSLAVDTYYYEDLNTWFDFAVTSFLFFCVLIIAFLGRKIAESCLHPVDTLSSYAENLSPQNLSARLPEENLPNELKGLVNSFNNALKKLEESHKRQAAFNSDVAHELRTPVGNLIGESEVALSRPRSAPELEIVLQSNLEELERLRCIVNDMLFLSRADQGETILNFQPTSLAQEVLQTADFLDVIFEENRNKLEIDGDAIIFAEPSLLKRALTNLLNNAIEHGLTKKNIKVIISDHSNYAEVKVINYGQDIPSEQIPLIFNRFYRINKERPNSSSNHGLGLAIVKAIITMHHGQVFATSHAGLITIGFTIPK